MPLGGRPLNRSRPAARHPRPARLRVRITIMSSKTLDEHIERTPDTAGGRPRIRGRRITVQQIAIWHDRLGKSADKIAAEFTYARRRARGACLLLRSSRGDRRADGRGPRLRGSAPRAHAILTGPEARLAAWRGLSFSPTNTFPGQSRSGCAREDFRRLNRDGVRAARRSRPSAPLVRAGRRKGPHHRRRGICAWPRPERLTRAFCSPRRTPVSECSSEARC